MFTLRKPSRQLLHDLHDRHREAAFNYSEVGQTRSSPPPGYVVDHNRSELGAGAETFARARQALEAWRMFQLAWLEPCWPEAKIAEGELVGTLARLGGVCWTANVCRISYVLDEPLRFGFGYGTLRGHLLHGEERFLVEQRADGSVWFDILAFSRPARLRARVGYPVVRRFQRRFAREAKEAMRRAVAGTLCLDNPRPDGSMTPTLGVRPERTAGTQGGGV